MIRPLDDVIDNDLVSGYVSGLWNPGDSIVRGSLYGVPRLIMQLGPPAVGMGILWNKSLFEREGLPDLYEVYEAGDWTWKVLRDIAISATRDTTGDGVVDQYGLRFGYNRDEAVLHWLATNGGTTTRIVDGNVAVALDEPQAIEAFAFIQELMYEQNVVGGGAGLTAMEWIWSDAIQYDHFQDYGDEWGIVPAPVGPAATAHVAPHNGEWMVVFPVTVEDPRPLIEVHNALMKLTLPYWDVDMETRERIIWEEDHRARIAFDRQSVETMRWTAINRQILPHVRLLLDAGLSSAITQMVANGVKPLTSIAEVMPALQGAMDELYGQ